MSLNIPPLSQGWVGGKKFFLCCFADLVKRRGQGNMRLNCARKNSQLENKNARKTCFGKTVWRCFKTRVLKLRFLGGAIFTLVSKETAVTMQKKVMSAS